MGGTQGRRSGLPRKNNKKQRMGEGWVLIILAPEGPGRAPRQQHHLWRRFWQTRAQRSVCTSRRCSQSAPRATELLSPLPTTGSQGPLKYRGSMQNLAVPALWHQGITGGTAQAAGGLSWRSRCCSRARAFSEAQQTHLFERFHFAFTSFSFLLSSSSSCLHPNVQTQLQFSGWLLISHHFICSHAIHDSAGASPPLARPCVQQLHDPFTRGQLPADERESTERAIRGPVRCFWPFSLPLRRPSTKNSVDFCADGECRDDGEIRLTLLLSVAGASDHQISPRQVGRGWRWIPRLVAAPIRPLSPLLMSLIHQPLPEIASSPPPSPTEPRLPPSGHTMETTRALKHAARCCPWLRRPKTGCTQLLRLSIVSAASEAPCDAHRASVVPLLCVWVASGRWNRLRVASHASPHTAEFSATAVWATSGLGGGKNGTRRILALVSH